MTSTRRAVLAGAGAAFALPLRAAAPDRVTPDRGAPGRVRGALDAAAAAPPGEGVRMLAGLHGATPSQRLDLETAREGLAVDDLMARVRTTGSGRFALLLRRQVGDIEMPVARARIEREHARVAARADRLLRAVGLASGSVGDRYRRLWRDDRHLYPDTDAGRDRAVADMNRALAAVRPQLAGWFGPLPPYAIAAVARRMGREDEARARGGYREVPTPDRPGGYFVDLARIRDRPSWTLPGVVHHELLPGHMVQLPIEAAADPHPLRLRYAPAFAEGWATYAETLPRHANTLDELGHLHWLLFRLCRARVDIGLHVDGWTTGQALDRLAEWQGVPAYFAPWDTDVPRMQAEPATRTAEAVMWLAIADLAAGTRGAALVRLHRAILADGRKRLTALRRSV